MAANQAISKWPTLILCCVVAAAIAPDLAQAQQGLRPEPPPQGSGSGVIQEALPGRMTAPGPGKPNTESIGSVPVAPTQNVAASENPPNFG